MNEGSKFLLRANPALTTNIKLVVDSKYNLYLESYNANKELSDNAFKMQQISSSSFLSERIATFWKGIPSNLAYQVKNDIKSDIIQTNLNLQYDDIYYSGMRKVEDIRYEEEFQYNTTLKINPDKLPKFFFVFRVDGPGLMNLTDAYDIKNSVIDQFKVVSYFNLTKETNVGKLWQKNYIDDDQIPRTPLELNFKKYEFSKWNGYDYNSGGTTSKSFFLDEIMRNQTTHFEFEKFITESFQKNEVVCSNFSNISFLYNDTVSDRILKYDGFSEYDIDQYTFLHDYINNGILKPSEYTLYVDNATQKTYFRAVDDFVYRKKWTINRYYGFYVDELEYLNKVSPYVPVQLTRDSNIEIVDNKFLYGGVNGTNIDPTVNGITPETPSYIKIGNDYYLIEQNDSGEYVIISDKNFNFNSSTNTGNILTILAGAQKPIKIVQYTLGTGQRVNLLTYIDDTPFRLYNSQFHEYQRNSVHLIKIYDTYYKLNAVTVGYEGPLTSPITGWYINTDEIFECDGNQFIKKYGENQKEIRSTQILSKNDTIPYFEIYKIQFTEIADWDYQRDITNYADIEYELDDQPAYNRPFLFEKNFNDFSVNNKSPYEERGYQIDTQYPAFLGPGWPLPYTIFPTTQMSFILPVTSEYGANGDLYMLNAKSDISSIWDINQSVVKWGWNYSISNCAYPYKINNNLDYSGEFNFSCNPFTMIKNSNNMTHDWFYTHGAPSIHSEIVDNYSMPFDAQYVNYTLNIDPPYERKFGPYSTAIDTDYAPTLDYYLDPKSSFNWFDWYFNSPQKIRTYKNRLYPKFLWDNDVFKDFRINNIIRTAKFGKSDNVNGPQVLFRGLNAYIEYVDTFNPNIAGKYSIFPANDLEGYDFAAYFNIKEVPAYKRGNFNSAELGRCGIDIILNKVHKNVLIYIWINAPYKSITNLHYNCRDNAMSEEYVSYSFYDTVQAAWVTHDSKLSMSALTLSHMIKILNSTSIEAEGFTDGITYKVVENKEEWTVNQTYQDYSASYDIISTSTFFRIQLDHYLDVKEGDWIYVSGVSGLPNKNYQIEKIDRQYIYTFKTADGFDYSSIILTAFTNAIITKEISVIPFRLRCTLPDEIKVDKTINILQADLSSPITPQNTVKTIGDVLKFDRYYDKEILNNVWIDNPITRVLNKQPREKYLDYNEINALPSMWRYSGDYDPITVNLNLFDRTSLQLLNYDETSATYNLYPLDFYTKIYDGKYHLTFSTDDYYLVYFPSTYQWGLLDQMKIGDLIYLRDIGYPLIYYPDLSNQIFEIIDFVKTPIIGGPTNAFNYEIVTSKVYDSNVYPYLPAGPSRSNIEMHVFSKINARTSFKYNNTDFGINKGVIVAKEWLTLNPLKSSAPIYNTKNKWAMIDEHGVTVVNRNIFKSSWDFEYYYEINKNVYNEYLP